MKLLNARVSANGIRKIVTLHIHLEVEVDNPDDWLEEFKDQRFQARALRLALEQVEPGYQNPDRRRD